MGLEKADASGGLSSKPGAGEGDVHVHVHVDTRSTRYSSKRSNASAGLGAS